jgi:hypothetical protein
MKGPRRSLAQPLSSLVLSPTRHIKLQVPQAVVDFGSANETLEVFDTKCQSINKLVPYNDDFYHQFGESRGITILK